MIMSEEWIDLRLVSIMRLMLATSALMVTVIDPRYEYLNATYALLILFSVYSAIFYFLSIKRSKLIPVGIMHWLDVGWFVALIALTNGTNSIFFTYFFFCILVASFGWGYSTGLYVTLVSAALFTAVGFILAADNHLLPLNRFLLRPVQLLMLGYLISRWGGYRINLRNQLKLLKDVTVLSHTRFGIDRTIGNILESLRAFYDADATLLLIPAHEIDGKFTYRIYRVRRGVHPTGASPPEISAEAAELFLLPESFAVIYRKDRRAKATFFRVDSRETTDADSALADRVASALETTNYLSTPVHNLNRPTGRLYVVGGPRKYDTAAIDFVLQLMDHVTPSIENIRLVDSLASYAAEEERRRIARDIHDSVIQPYVGLQLGIAALAQKLHSGNSDIVNNVEELLDLTNQELIELRRYVWGLRVGEERRDVLLPAIERFAARFSSVTGIKVDVNTRGKIQINDRLAAELFQIVTEGLSNIRRHALCNDASVDVACRDGKIRLQIKNRRSAGTGNFYEETHQEEPAIFTPRSISERASLLGGETLVSFDKNYTVVTVAIPL
jgi:signal transduction histidine kinase